MRTLFFTGNGGNGIALAAAMTATTAAQQGQRTLLASAGPSHSLGALLGTSISDTPENVAPNLDVWALDIFKSMSTYLEKLRPRLTGILARISGEEIPTVPSLDLFIALEYLFQKIADQYELVVIDAGQHDALLRALAVPDGFRWLMRLIFGLDRGPGRNMETLNNALISANLLPFEWLGVVQNVRVQLELLRNNAVDTRHATTRYVLRPDTAALDEAYMAIPAIQMHGMAVDALVVGPLLPNPMSDTSLQGVVAEQQDIVETATHTWSSLPILHLPLSQVRGIDALGTMGHSLYAGHRLDTISSVKVPIEEGKNEEGPYLVLRLPGLQRGALSLTLSYDELVVRTGPYRRHILIPDWLRGTRNIRATRDGNEIIIRRRPDEQ